MSVWDAYFASLALLLLPLLYLQIIYLWEKQHMQFFPLAYTAAGWFFFKEAKPEPLPCPTRQWSAFILAFVSMAMVAVSLFIASPWLAQLTIVVLAFTWALGSKGSITTLRIAGICGLLLVCVPFPLGLDHQLVQGLQSLSSTICSRLIDLSNIIHVRRGNIIEIVSKPLFVEEACSGVDSQYALMAVAGVLLLVSRTGLIVSLITIITVPIWAILGNLLRIYLIVVGLEWFDIDISSGTSHTILGLVVFGIAAWAHWSSVQLLNFLQLKLFGATGFGSPTFSTDRAVMAPPSTPFSSRWILTIPMALLFLFPAGIAAVVNHHTKMVPTISKQDADLFPGEPDLPKYVGVQIRDGFQSVSRDRLNLLGQMSRTWIYHGELGTQLASLDFPFRGWHPLWECYVNAGWTRFQSRLIDRDSTGQTLDFPYFETSLQNPQGDYGVLHFSLFDEFGKPYAFEGGFGMTASGNRFSANVLSWYSSESMPREPLTFQFQVLSTSSTPASEERLVKYRQTYLALRQVALEKSMPALEKLKGQ